LFGIRNGRYRRLYHHDIRNLGQFHGWRSCPWWWAGCHTHSWSSSNKLCCNNNSNRNKIGVYTGIGIEIVDGQDYKDFVVLESNRSCRG
jgi:hypothetical protein